MTAKTYLPEARERLAETLAAKGTPYHSVANSVRAGHSNMWIEAAVAAIASTVRNPLDEDE